MSIWVLGYEMALVTELDVSSHSDSRGWTTVLIWVLGYEMVLVTELGVSSHSESRGWTLGGSGGFNLWVADM